MKYFYIFTNKLSLSDIFIILRWIEFEKRFSQSDLKYHDCFLIHWLLMKCILAILGRISRNQFKCNYLRNKQFFVKFPLCLWSFNKGLNILKRRWASYLKYLRNYWPRKTWLLKCQKGPVSEHLLPVNVLTGPKQCWNLHSSTFILLLHHSNMNEVGKCLS